MADVHPDRELAPRDVVARAIWERIAAGNRVFLDLRALFAEGGAERFPTVAGICRDAGARSVARGDSGGPGRPLPHGRDRHRFGGAHVGPRSLGVRRGGLHRLSTGPTAWPVTRCSRAWCSARRVAKDMDHWAVTLRIAPVGMSGLPALDGVRAAELRRELCDLVYRGAGIVRTEAGLATALRGVAAIRAELARAPRDPGPADFDHVRTTVELGNMVDCGRSAAGRGAGTLRKPRRASPGRPSGNLAARRPPFLRPPRHPNRRRPYGARGPIPR